jgi:phosphoglycerate dehydrogenase-like enzyme
MKAVLHHPISKQLARHLTDLSPAWLDLTVVPGIAESLDSAAMREAEVLLHVLHPVSAPLMDSAPALKLIQKVGVGVDAIDLPAAAARGIRITNMPGTNTQAVVEMTLGLMLAVLRRITLLDKATKEGRGWQLALDATEFGEIAGRTVGLIGYGAIPRTLAPVLRGLGARILYHSRTPASEAPEAWRSMPALLAEADIISLHLPLTGETRSIIDAAALAAMKPGAILINTSRGALIDESALFRALSSGRLRGAGLDVHAREPVRHPDAFLDLAGVVMTPHLAWLTWETWTRSWRVAMENCERLREGRPLIHQIQAEPEI